MWLFERLLSLLLGLVVAFIVLWGDQTKPYNSVERVSVERVDNTIYYDATFNKPTSLMFFFTNNCIFKNLSVYDDEFNLLSWTDMDKLKSKVKSEDETRPPGQHKLSLRVELLKRDTKELTIRVQHLCGEEGSKTIVGTIFDTIEL
jgi:hypothetical protein